MQRKLTWRLDQRLADSRGGLDRGAVRRRWSACVCGQQQGQCCREGMARGGMCRWDQVVASKHCGQVSILYTGISLVVLLLLGYHWAIDRTAMASHESPYHLHSAHGHALGLHRSRMWRLRQPGRHLRVPTSLKRPWLRPLMSGARLHSRHSRR